MERLDVIKSKLEKYNQTHILNFYNELSETEKNNLLDEVESIDFDLVLNLYNDKDKFKQNNDDIKPIKYIDKLKLSNDEIERYTKLGEAAIKNGEYAFATLAGRTRDKTWT